MKLLSTAIVAAALFAAGSAFAGTNHRMGHSAISAHHNGQARAQAYALSGDTQRFVRGTPEVTVIKGGRSAH